MKFSYKYFGSTTVQNDSNAQAFNFAPDTLRQPTYFEANLSSKGNSDLAFREALSALHEVVVSDMRTRGRDNSAYKAYLEANEGLMLAQLAERAGNLKDQAQALGAELAAVRREKARILLPFYKAQQRYFNWLYEANRDAWYVLDPVITVHPDRLLFEAFSQDESSYCAVSVSHNVFERVGEMACGTTNIDYSASLYDEFQKIRSYKTTRFAVDPSGFAVTTGDDAAFREEKIDVPDSWVRGFLQVTSAATLPATVLELHPMDLHNICATLRQHKERAGPRSLRFELAPNAPARMVFEPWGLALSAPRSRLHGAPIVEPMSLRIWGRRRLLVLERLIAQATKVVVHLLGSGMPSFWVIELGDITVTLGLSGWTANDWSSAGRFNLLQARHELSPANYAAVGQQLQARTYASPAEIASAAGISQIEANAALGGYVQAGRAVFDLPRGQYAWRELAREPLPLEALKFSSPEEAQALAFVHAGAVKLGQIKAGQTDSSQIYMDGTVNDKGTKAKFEPVVLLNADDQMIDARCTCNFFSQNKLKRGPCAHMLALRQLAAPKLDAVRKASAPSPSIPSAVAA